MSDSIIEWTDQKNLSMWSDNNGRVAGHLLVGEEGGKGEGSVDEHALDHVRPQNEDTLGPQRHALPYLLHLRFVSMAGLETFVLRVQNKRHDAWSQRKKKGVFKRVRDGG